MSEVDPMGNIEREESPQMAAKRQSRGLTAYELPYGHPLRRDEAEDMEALREQLRGAVEAERERIVALIRREASETFDMALDHELRTLADRIAAGGQ